MHKFVKYFSKVFFCKVSYNTPLSNKSSFRNLRKYCSEIVLTNTLILTKKFSLFFYSFLSICIINSSWFVNLSFVLRPSRGKWGKLQDKGGDRRDIFPLVQFGCSHVQYVYFKFVWNNKWIFHFSFKNYIFFQQQTLFQKCKTHEYIKKGDYKGIFFYIITLILRRKSKTSIMDIPV